VQAHLEVGDPPLSSMLFLRWAVCRGIDPVDRGRPSPAGAIDSGNPRPEAALPWAGTDGMMVADAVSGPCPYAGGDVADDQRAIDCHQHSCGR
jgi:hypothetical protein